MYLSIGIVLFALLLAVVICCGRKRAAVKKICSMTITEKCQMLNELIYPFGYCYDRSQDIISSHNHAWQREFGYTALFDKAAAHLNMVIDCLPVYFDYQGKTWLLELWKGQYGINTGAEIGLYYADEIIPAKERKTVLFQAVSDSDMLPMVMRLYRKGTAIASVSKKTWWLTVFSMGLFSRPEDLFLNTSLVFPDCEMLHCFLDGLSETGLPIHCIQICGLQLHLQFGGFIEKHVSCFQRLARWWSQFTNRLYCRLYLFLTRAFCLTLDRLLYLYYLLPFCFRHTLRLRRCKKGCLHKRR